MKSLIFTHWKTTLSGILLGLWVLLSNSPDVTTITWRELAERLPKALAVVCLGLIARDFERSEQSRSGDDSHG